jgi:hypothetical protein
MLPYDNWRAITYARTWCGRQTNSCGAYLDGPNRSDCAHFLAHSLWAGGLRVANGDPGTAFCPDGLAARNVDLVGALRTLAGRHANVVEIGLTDSIVGDIGFLDRPDRPYHAFMICEPVDLRTLNPVKVYAHSTSRCCDPMNAQWRQWFSTLFRITDA